MVFGLLDAPVPEIVVEPSYVRRRRMPVRSFTEAGVPSPPLVILSK